VHRSQITGAVLILVGLFVLFLLREPLVHLVIVVLQLIGIFIGFGLIVIGIAFLMGGRWIRRGPWGPRPTGT